MERENQEMERKWIGNGQRMWKWRENEKMKRKWRERERMGKWRGNCIALLAASIYCLSRECRENLNIRCMRK